ncbi:MAG: AMP-binding protein, partial [bacterium]|nr:AMP-binding protein [bacterium]
GAQVIINAAFREYLRRNQLYLHNPYGPSETHVVTTLTLDPKGEIPQRPPIGKPILNTTIYILDKEKHLVPLGVPGELYIGGKQVGRGYLGRKDLTTGKFIPSAFMPGETLYRSGDLARWLPDGNIEFLGRMDHQVKIRGFRVELAEIEGHLSNHPEIKEVVVVVGTDDSGGERTGTGINYENRYLCAYIVAGSDSEFDISQLHRYLSMSLPDYMVPGYFMQLEKIPIMPNGKVDHRALPVPGVK